jgi:predicted PurR-regulated permease PerM
MEPPRAVESDAADAVDVPTRRRAPIAPRQYLWVLGAAIVLAAALHWLGPVLTPFLVGAILAYLGNPIVNRCARAGIPRTLGTLIAVALLMLAIVALVVIIVPLLQAELGLMMRRLPELGERFTRDVAPWLERKFGIVIAFDLDTAKELVAANLDSARDLSLKLISGVKSGGLLLITLVVNIVLIPVVMFYLLRDWNDFALRLSELVPRRWATSTLGIARDVDYVLAEFLRGQILVMVSLAIYYAIALSVVGLRFAVPIGVLTGLLVFIPYVGFGLGLVLAMLAALLEWNGWPGFLAVAGVYGVGQIIENYVLVPYLVGDRIGLHPLAVIFALLAFGQLFGFAGVLLALPVSAALLVALRRVRAAYVASPLYREP